MDLRECFLRGYQDQGLKFLVLSEVLCRRFAPVSCLKAGVPGPGPDWAICSAEGKAGGESGLPAGRSPHRPDAAAGMPMAPADHQEKDRRFGYGKDICTPPDGHTAVDLRLYRSGHPTQTDESDATDAQIDGVQYDYQLTTGEQTEVYDVTFDKMVIVTVDPDSTRDSSVDLRSSI